MKRRTLLKIAIQIVALCFCFGCIQGNTEDYAEFKSKELRCIIGNNTAMGEVHREGYNGIFKLQSIHQERPLFVEKFAGLNLEHYFDGSGKITDHDVFFEPRRVHMEFEKADERTAVLRQDPTPTWHVESRTEFKLVDPYYIDVEFEFIPREDVFEGGALGVFWASYINGPLNKSFYFLTNGSTLEKPFWHQHLTQYHNHDSTVKWEQDDFVWEFSEESPETLFSNFSEIRFSQPFYYGKFRNMVWIVIFKDAEGIRFAHSPSGGGINEEGNDSNPAWDFQLVVPNYQIDQSYSVHYRAVYKRWVDREDVINEVKQYLNE